jgi:hypothetical protein
MPHYTGRVYEIYVVRIELNGVKLADMCRSSALQDAGFSVKLPTVLIGFSASSSGKF